MSFFQVGWSPDMKSKSKIFALKYRPQTFKDLIGQHEVSSTIFNSVRQKKTANAYLFTGIRGVGKTTFARILAKSLNCDNGVDNLCVDNFCNNCQSIANSNHIDVLEIDAASKTGVDDVRELIEFSRYRPSIANYKIFIIDEVHMLSKQAFNALLKTMEEPPEYLKFIFATTEIKKIPITVISRCQRYDLSRISSLELYSYLKKIITKESKNVEDDALKLIVKISEGSVRDALSLLDRALLSKNQSELLTFEECQNIFGYADKSSYISLLENILSGKELEVLQGYKNLYNAGVEPQVFLNEILEILYYLKNINYIKLDGNNFSLSDSDYKKIKLLSNQIETGQILLFWEFTLKTIKEINIVNNQNLSLEMYIMQLMYIYQKNNIKTNREETTNKNHQAEKTKILKNKVETVSQIKNINQEEEALFKDDSSKDKNQIPIKNINDLITMCINKKELSLKFELENNVNLVTFVQNRIEISFNEKLNKNFVKDLSSKLYEWTNTRWIISFSKQKGEMTVKEKKEVEKKNFLKEIIETDEYNYLLNIFPDIELISRETIKKND